MSIQRRYETKEKLGSGTYGDVYKCVETTTGNVYVLKKLKATTQATQLLREISIMQRLSRCHPNIVKLVAVEGLGGASPELVMEKLPLNLLQFLQSFRDLGFVPMYYIKIIIRDILRAVAFLHSRTIAHRDLKPENVLIDFVNRQTGEAVVHNDMAPEEVHRVLLKLHHDLFHTNKNVARLKRKVEHMKKLISDKREALEKELAEKDVGRRSNSTALSYASAVSAYSSATAALSAAPLAEDSASAGHVPAATTPMSTAKRAPIRVLKNDNDSNDTNSKEKRHHEESDEEKDENGQTTSGVDGAIDDSHGSPVNVMADGKHHRPSDRRRAACASVASDGNNTISNANNVNARNNSNKVNITENGACDSSCSVSPADEHTNNNNNGKGRRSSTAVDFNGGASVNSDTSMSFGYSSAPTPTQLHHNHDDNSSHVGGDQHHHDQGNHHKNSAHTHPLSSLQPPHHARQLSVNSIASGASISPSPSMTQPRTVAGGASTATAPSPQSRQHQRFASNPIAKEHLRDFEKYHYTMAEQSHLQGQLSQLSAQFNYLVSAQQQIQRGVNVFARQQLQQQQQREGAAPSPSAIDPNSIPPLDPQTQQYQFQQVSAQMSQFRADAATLDAKLSKVKATLAAMLQNPATAWTQSPTLEQYEAMGLELDLQLAESEEELERRLNNLPIYPIARLCDFGMCRMMFPSDQTAASTTNFNSGIYQEQSVPLTIPQNASATIGGDGCTMGGDPHGNSTSSPKVIKPAAVNRKGSNLLNGSTEDESAAAVAVKEGDREENIKTSEPAFSPFAPQLAVNQTYTMFSCNNSDSSRAAMPLPLPVHQNNDFYAMMTSPTALPLPLPVPLPKPSIAAPIPSHVPHDALNPPRQPTPRVMTISYRAAEVLLDKPLYNHSIDIWSVGCLIPELVTLNILVEYVQLQRREGVDYGDGIWPNIINLFKVLGVPKDGPEWAAIADPSVASTFAASFPNFKSKLREVNNGKMAEALGEDGMDLLQRMLVFVPEERITAQQALDHPWLSDVQQQVGAFRGPDYSVLPMPKFIHHSLSNGHQQQHSLAPTNGGLQVQESDAHHLNKPNPAVIAH